MSERRYFIARISGQEGPLSHAQVAAGLASGRYTGNELSWSETESGEWLPLTERPEFRGLASGSRPTPDRPVEPTVRSPALDDAEPAPVQVFGKQAPSTQQIELVRRAGIAWRRFLARNFDLAISVVLIMLLQRVHPPLLNLAQDVLMLIAAALWPWLEALFLGSFGTTPGKALLRLRLIRVDGERFDYSAGLQRALRVWTQGLGLGLPLVTTLASIFAFNRYTRTGQTLWDEHCATRVEALPITATRMGIIMGVVVASIVLGLMRVFGAAEV